MALKKAGVQLVAEGSDTILSAIAQSDKAVAGFGATAATAASKVAAYDQRIARTNDTIDLQNRQLAILRRQLAETVEAHGAGSIAAQKQELAVDKLSASIRNNQTTVDRLQGEMARLATAENETTAETRQLDAGMDTLAASAHATAEATERAARQTSAAGDIMTGALRKVGEVAVDAFLEAGRAMVGFALDSIDVAGDFEAGMNRFSAVAGDALKDAGLELKDFRDQFIQIGKELPVSTSEVQDAAIEMVKGGIEPATIAAGGLKQVIQFAAAADLDLAEASTIAAKAIGGWVDQAADANEKAAFLAHSTDLLSKAANASTVNVDDLALGLYNVQGTAKLAGVSFDETVTALAQLAPAFSSSADAGTSFKTFLARLQPTTGPAIAAFHDLGLVAYDTQHSFQFLKERGIDPIGLSSDQIAAHLESFADQMGLSGEKFDEFMASFERSAFYDAAGNFVGMAEASKLLQGATEGLTEAQRLQVLQTIFGQDAIRTAAVFSEQGADGFNNMTAALEKQNSVQEMAAQKQAGYNTALENAKGSLEALQITVGSAVLPVLTRLLNDVIAPGINVLTDLAGALAGDADAFDRLSPPMREVATAIADVWKIGEELVALFQSASDESSELSGVLTDLGDVWKLQFSVIESVAKGYEAIISAVLPIVEKFIASHGKEIDAFFTQTYDSIMEIITTAMKLYEAIVPPILNAIAGFITAHGKEISQILDGTWKALTAIIDGALTLIKGILTIALQLINGDWEGAWTTAKETGERLWDDIVQLIEGNIEIVDGLFGGFVDMIRDLPGQLAGVGEAIVSEIWDGIRSRWDELLAWWYDQLEDFRDSLPFSEPKDPSSPLRGLTDTGATIMSMIQQGMDRAGGLSLPGGARIAPPATMHIPRPQIIMVQPASTQNYYGQVGNNTTNTQMGGGLPYDHMAAMYGSRG